METNTKTTVNREMTAVAKLAANFHKRRLAKVTISQALRNVKTPYDTVPLGSHSINSYTNMVNSSTVAVATRAYVP